MVSKTTMTIVLVVGALLATAAATNTRRPRPPGDELPYPPLPACQNNPNGKRCNCEKSFFNRDVRPDATRQQQEDADAFIQDRECCELLIDDQVVTVNGSTCGQVTNFCGWNFRPYSNMCTAEACATGRQFNQKLNVATQQLGCSKYMSTTCFLVPDLMTRLGCLNLQLTQLIGSVLLGVLVGPTGPLPDPQFTGANALTCNPAVDGLYRRADGGCNSFSVPWSGITGGRILRHSYTRNTNNEELWKSNPVNPRAISNTMFRRTTYKPTTLDLNMLAAAWVNFFVHDFFGHEVDWQDVVNVPLPPGDTLASPFNERYLQVPRHKHAPAISTAGRREYRNRATAWFDASQLYGNDDATARSLRSFQNGRLKVNGELLPDQPTTAFDHSRMRLPGTAAPFLSGDLDGRHNIWVGTTFLHNLFTLEHNNVAAQLAQQPPPPGRPAWDDESLYQIARLIVSAEIVKIHNVEWTNQLADETAIHAFIQILWDQIGQPFGPLPGGNRTVPILSSTGVFAWNQFDLRWITTHNVAEDFITAYRWHAMIKESLDVFDNAGAAVSGQKLEIFETFRNTQRHRDLGLRSLLQTFGRNEAGDLTYNNVADGFRDMRHPSLYTDNSYTPFTEPKCEVIRAFDMATADVVREREHAGLRFNEQRAVLGGIVPQADHFSDIVQGDPDKALELAKLYNWNIATVDLMTGAIAEKKLPVEGFSTTILATFMPFVYNRVKFDRFFTNSFNAVTYTPWGLARLRGQPNGSGQYPTIFPSGVIQGVTLRQIIQENLGIDVGPSLKNGKIFKTWNPV